MMRNNTASSMQKTYDECYLKCSTALYFEDQGNEAEALRSWRSALDQIYYHNAYRVSPHYRPRSETEKALKDSLRDMEVQCKERVDLLDALNQSRLEAIKASSDGSTDSISLVRSKISQKPKKSSESEREQQAEGKRVATNHAETSLSAPPLPARPMMAAKTKSAVVSPRIPSVPQVSVSRSSLELPSVSLNMTPVIGTRSSSPDKKTGMKTTLRTNKDGKARPARSSMSTGQRRESGIAASKAATQAWVALPRQPKDALGRSLGEVASSASVNTLREDSHGQHLPGRAVSMEHTSRSNIFAENDASATIPSLTDYMHGSWHDSPPGGSSQLRATSRQDDVRRSSVQSQVSQEPVDLDLLNPSVPRSTHGRSPAAVHSNRSPIRASTASYEWPSYQATRDASSTSKKSSTSANHQPKRPARATADVSAFASPGTPRPPLEPRYPATATSSDILSRKPPSHASTPRKSRSSKVDPRITSSSPDTELLHLHQQGDHTRLADSRVSSSGSSSPIPPQKNDSTDWNRRVDHLSRNLPPGIDESAAKQIFNEIVVQGDEVHWSDVAGLDIAKNALKEAVVYPFLRPDLFMGLREPARGMLLFGPPGTGKTMLARAVATESRSTFFSISASSLTSKYLGESEKLVRALFSLAKALAPSIIFVDEIDSLLSSRSGTEHEATRRIKTEFLIQWSDLARAAAGREQTNEERERGDASRVLVLAATNLPWMIDEAARRRFVRRQYIPLPEANVRALQLRTLLGAQKHDLDASDIQRLVEVTNGFSGSDITALAKDAAMGPLRSLGEALLHMSMDEIRPIQFQDFQASLVNIRPSVSKQGLKQFEEWAREFGERGG